MSRRVASPVFVGRTEELDVLKHALSLAATGAPNLVLVGGEAGVGKSRLLSEVGDRVRADHDATLLVGGCLDLGEATLPYAPFVEALRDLGRQLGTERFRGLLGPARRPLSRLLPELDPVGSGVGDVSGETDSQTGLFDAVLGAVARLAADRPLVLALEDLHWADRATLDLLAFLVHSLREEPVVLIGTFRSDELHRRGSLRPVLSELVRLPNVERIELPRFDRREVAEQAAAILGIVPDDALLDDVCARSEGNPFYTEVLLADAQSDREPRLPPTIREILVDRVSALPHAARQVLRVAATVGRDVDDRLLEEVAALPAEELRKGLREAVAHQILVPGRDGTTLRFRHALVQEAVHDDLLPHERIALHADVAAALERRPDLASGGVSAVHGELAHHWSVAHDMPRAFVASVTAAGHAYDLFAFNEAQHHYERALELWDAIPTDVREATVARSELLSRAASAASNAGYLRRALTLQRAAIDEIGPDGPVEERVRLLAFYSVMHWLAGEPEGAFAVIDEALASLPAEASMERVRLLDRRARLLMLTSREAEAVDVARETVEVAREVGHRRIEGRALNTLGFSLAFAGDEDAGMAHLRSALAIALEVQDVASVTAAYVNLSDILALAGRLVESYELAREGLRWFEERGVSGPVPHFVRLNAVLALYWLGRWSEAEALFEEVPSVRGQNVSRTFHACVGGLLRTGQGRFKAARRHVDEAVTLTRDGGDPQFVIPLAAVQMELACWLGGPWESAALTRAIEVGREAPSWIALFLPTAARAQAEAGDRAALVELIALARAARS
ncbi:MAG: ATP-binding protein, partial [Nitriliruptorales bacterium]